MSIPLDDMKYFEVYLDLFQHPGWKQLVEDTQETLKGYDYDNCKDYEQFLKVKSAREQLLRIINFEDRIRVFMEQQKYELENSPDDGVDSEGVYH